VQRGDDGHCRDRQQKAVDEKERDEAHRSHQLLHGAILGLVGQLGLEGERGKKNQRS